MKNSDAADKFKKVKNANYYFVTFKLIVYHTTKFTILQSIKTGTKKDDN